MAKVALITGITGQDGSYLTEFLLNKGYQVHGMMRRASVFTTQRIEHLYQDRHEDDVSLRLHYGDLLDPLQSQRGAIAQVVDDDNLVPRLQQFDAGVGTDIAGAAGDQDTHPSLSWVGESAV